MVAVMIKLNQESYLNYILPIAGKEQQVRPFLAALLHQLQHLHVVQRYKFTDGALIYGDQQEH